MGCTKSDIWGELTCRVWQPNVTPHLGMDQGYPRFSADNQAWFLSTDVTATANADKMRIEKVILAKAFLSNVANLATLIVASAVLLNF